MLAQVAAALGLKASQVLAAQVLDNGPVWLGCCWTARRPCSASRPTTGSSSGWATRSAWRHRTRAGAAGPQLEVRAFAAPIGITEDPVTGSLNASLAQWLIAADVPARYLAAQGACLDRAGRVHIERDRGPGLGRRRFGDLHRRRRDAVTFMIFQSDEVDAARSTVYSVMPPTPQYAWPLLRERLGMTVWVKHENHTPAGAFKVRGGLTYFSALANSGAGARGVITATRGNHGQSVGFAARRVRPGRHDRRAAWQFGGEERGDARARRHADRARRGFPGRARTCGRRWRRSRGCTWCPPSTAT